ncbi:unnamed protein product [Phaedon cochleariae]|uniref:Uncharacterized protein n=1 Tax=Phaedon cochleariae TaxID=80249 RepID=A0A9P0D9W5_PHACE|nr:unnamed protein product [Phaedon cochleariae]
MAHKFNEDFLNLFCEKNSDGTKNLRLKGNELQQRIGSRVKAKDMHCIANFLNAHREITRLDLSYNDFGDKGLMILSDEYFSRENDLLHINIMHCDIGVEGLELFSCSECLHLKSCRLNGNKIGSRGARFIAQLIDRCPSLEYIDIAETDQTLESIESILIVIEHSTIKVLDISRIIPNSYYTKYNKATLADDLSVVLKLNQTLVELHVQKFEFDGHDVELLLSGLNVNKTLLVLDLGCNAIGDLGMEILSEWLKTRPSCRALNVSSNDIHDSGARALSFGLPFSKLRFLDISNNNIGDSGLVDLLNTLKKFCRMRMLFLWGNKFGPHACHKLDRMLESKVLEQDYLDIKIYKVDEKLHAAYYPVNHYKHIYYNVMDHGCPVELKIKKNKIIDPAALPRELLNMSHYGRYPPVDESLGLKKEVQKVCKSEVEQKEVNDVEQNQFSMRRKCN